MKNKKSMAIIGTVVGVCILGTAAFANYQTANGYEALKKSLLNLPSYENYTMDVEASISADGKQLQASDMTVQADAASELMYSSSLGTYSDSQYTDKSWYQDGKRIHYDSESDSYSGYSTNFVQPLTGANFSSDEKANKNVTRFVELMADTIVGDLKNNFVCLEDGEETSTYEVNLSAIQIPELINAGLAAMCSVSADGWDTSEMPEDTKALVSMGDNPLVESAKCTFTVNKDNSIKNIDAEVVFAGVGDDGQRHDVTVSGKLDISNVGTTTVEKLDTSKVNIHFWDEDEFPNYAVTTEGVNVEISNEVVE